MSNTWQDFTSPQRFKCMEKLLLKQYWWSQKTSRNKGVGVFCQCQLSGMYPDCNGWRSVHRGKGYADYLLVLYKSRSVLFVFVRKINLCSNLLNLGICKDRDRLKIGLLNKSLLIDDALRWDFCTLKHKWVAKSVLDIGLRLRYHHPIVSANWEQRGKLERNLVLSC